MKNNSIPYLCVTRRSAAVRLLGLRVRILPGHACQSLVNVLCCQIEVSVLGWSLVQRSPTDCGVSCVIYKSQEWGGHGLRWTAAPLEKKTLVFNLLAKQHNNNYYYILLLCCFLLSQCAHVVTATLCTCFSASVWNTGQLIFMRVLRNPEGTF